MASLAKWLSVHLRTKWLGVRVPLQSIYAISPFWKKIIKETDNTDNLLLLNHHLIKKKHINWYCETKSKAIILSLYIHPSCVSTSQKCFNELFKTDSSDWKQIHLLPHLVILGYSRSFQYKILNNFLHLNKKLFTFRKLTSPLCTFCKLSNETVLHLFYECHIVQNLWSKLDLFFENDFALFDLTPQAAFLGFLNVDSKLFLIQNHLLLIFKIYIYNSRRSESLMIKFLIREIMKVKKTEEKISISNEKKHAMYKRKWQQVENVLKTKTF